MIRLLTTGLSNTASGTRSMMMNWYRYMDRDKIQYDFLVRPDFNQPELEKEIRTLGGNIYREQYTHREKPITFKRDMYNFFDRHPEINGVHMNLNHHGYILPLEIAQNLSCFFAQFWKYKSKRKSHYIQLYKSHSKEQIRTNEHRTNGVF